MKARIFDSSTSPLDDSPSHAERVRDTFLHDAPVGWTCDIEARPVTASVMQDALDDGVILPIYPQGGVWTHQAIWRQAAERGALVVASHGANENGEYLPDPPGLYPFLVCVGGETLTDGDPEDDRSYGPGLTLDAQAHDGETAESYTAPTVAAALAHLYDRYGAWPAALSALITLVSNGTGAWSERRGYGLYVSGTDLSAAAPLVWPAWLAQPIPRFLLWAYL